MGFSGFTAQRNANRRIRSVEVIKQGWEQFTDTVIDVISTQYDHIVFVLWGNYAKQKGSELIESGILSWHQDIQHPWVQIGDSGSETATLVKPIHTLLAKENRKSIGSYCFVKMIVQREGFTSVPSPIGGSVILVMGICGWVSSLLYENLFPSSVPAS